MRRPPPIALRRPRPISRLRDRLALGRRVRLRGRFRGRRGLLAFLAVMGPGLIAGIAGNDAGGITTYSVLGAETGLTLLWLFPITIVILAIVQEMAARLGVVTGQGLSDLIRDRFGVRPDGVRDARAAGRERGQHRRRVLRCGRGPRDLRHLALHRGADHGRSPSGRS